MKAMKIGELARRSGTGIETIRFYEREGLLLKVERQPSGYRQYDEATVGRLDYIRQAKELGFTQLIEPLRMLFKDEVRALGETLGLPHDLVWRQPFPGPGLAIRVIGDLTPEKVEIVRESDAVLREEIAKAGLDADIHQYFTVLTGIRSVGVMGDERTYDYTVAIRAVTTDDFMTADWARIPYDVVRTISARIVNEVPHVNRVVLDVTTKPPASIEWE